MSEATFLIDDGHPSLAGHFPGQPVVPGVVILDEVIAAAAAAAPGMRIAGIREAKFRHPLPPGVRCLLAFTPARPGQLRFRGWHGDKTVVEGSLNLVPATA
ncbi:hypothetical protein [Acidihalobacter prosperus]|uniref:hypothetical protein n=1 Tax=Acidihalobacter prosperus TaxID=160660 RepID=UPI000507DE0A